MKAWDIYSPLTAPTAGFRHFPCHSVQLRVARYTQNSSAGRWPFVEGTPWVGKSIRGLASVEPRCNL
jgi:hypothetical protein